MFGNFLGKVSMVIQVGLKTTASILGLKAGRVGALKSHQLLAPFFVPSMGIWWHSILDDSECIAGGGTAAGTDEVCYEVKDVIGWTMQQ